MNNLQTTNSLMGVSKQKFGIILGITIGAAALLCILLSCITYYIGINSVLNEEMVKQKLLQEETYNELNSKISKLKTDIQNNEALLDELNTYKENKEQKTAEITQLDNDIATKSATVSSLDNDITTKTAELDRLKNAIQVTGEAPKVLPAGQYTVGTDIQPGRYIVTGKSNFVVYSAYGDLKVNTILGGGSWGEESYTCTLETGDKLELSSKDTFTPIK